MMKMLVTGLRPGVTEDEVRMGMEKLGPVDTVEIVSTQREDEKNCWAIVEMPISAEKAEQIASRVTDIWHEGAMVNIQVMHR